MDQHVRAFIEKSPFLLLATADEAGLCDASPRGDAPGFVMVVDGVNPEKVAEQLQESYTKRLY
ncbi:pyridoxamine 5'-phosphate oxidase family protein [Brevibacillus sp. H7]|uniref:pyridoxamine 5'-phosphate oxidase family protein n=1 Tax=Brevibacillus sp. H7 TaxID=3349138 RepID=UPI0037F506C9